MKIDKFTDLPQTRDVLEQAASRLGVSEFTIVENPSYIYRTFDIYPMAPRITGPRSRLVAIVKDMDGTTTTTEELCVHSLEFMVGKICGLDKKRGWKGLEDEDHPHIIGNSTTKHVEYLIQAYGERIEPASFRKAYLSAVLWFLAEGRDPGRREDMLSTVAALGLRDLPNHPAFTTFVSRKETDPGKAGIPWKRAEE